MENRSDVRYQAGQAAGQAQVKKDEMMDKARETKDQTSNYLQQTGEQMMGMAQKATDNVKNAVGAGSNTSTNTTTNKF